MPGWVIAAVGIVVKTQLKKDQITVRKNGFTADNLTVTNLPGSLFPDCFFCGFPEPPFSGNCREPLHDPASLPKNNQTTHRLRIVAVEWWSMSRVTVRPVAPAKLMRTE